MPWSWGKIRYTVAYKEKWVNEYGHYRACIWLCTAAIGKSTLMWPKRRLISSGYVAENIIVLLLSTLWKNAVERDQCGIFLLVTLGKVLEAVIASRAVYLTRVHVLLPNIHFGAWNGMLSGVPNLVIGSGELAHIGKRQFITCWIDRDNPHQICAYNPV